MHLGGLDRRRRLRGRDPATAEAVNGEAPACVARACAAAGVPLVYVSTDFVFDGRNPGAPSPTAKTTRSAPLSVYGAPS